MDGFTPNHTLMLTQCGKRVAECLVIIRATIQDETTKIQEYIRKIAPNDDLLSELLRGKERRRETIVEGQAPALDAPLTDRGSS